MKKHIVCLGDSNTHGYCCDPTDSADGGIRFNEDERWTGLLQKALGEDYLVIEEGLCGRTTVFEDPLQEGQSALPYIHPCLRSHLPVDLLIIMLGSNDTKDRINVSAACIAQGMERLVNKAKSVTEAWGERGPNILILAPTYIGEEMANTPVVARWGTDCIAKTRELPGYYRESAKLLGVHYAEAVGCELGKDHMHLSRRGHAQLAERLIPLIPTLV